MTTQVDAFGIDKQDDMNRRGKLNMVFSLLDNRAFLWWFDMAKVSKSADCPYVSFSSLSFVKLGMLRRPEGFFKHQGDVRKCATHITNKVPTPDAVRT